MKALSATQVAAWRRDGFLFPLSFLTEQERQNCLAGLARFEEWLGAPVNASKELKWRTMPHLTLPWVTRLTQSPKLLDIIEDLIGPDIFVYTSTFFIKEPHTDTIAAWHQDSTYYGLMPKEEVTVWVALSDASLEAGCMDVLPFDGGPVQYPHAAHVVKNSVNRAGQEITVPLDENRAVAMPLKPGQISLHHGMCVHRSGPNTTDQRRIGLGLNFVPGHVRPIGAHKLAGMLVRGEDKHGYLESVSPPTEELSAEAIATHELAVSRYRDTYFEQEALVARQGA